MNGSEMNFVQVMPWLVVATGAIVISAWRGWLWPGGLRGVPYRDAGLGVLDLLIALLVLLAGMLLVGPVLVGLGLMLPPDSNEPAVELSTLQRAAHALLIQGITLFPVMVYLLGRTYRHEGGWEQLGLSGKRGGRLLLTSLLGLLLGTPIVLATLAFSSWFGWQVLNQPMPELGHDMLQAMRGWDHLGGLIGLVISAVIIAPLLEEMIFRGLIQTALLELELARIHRWSVILISASVFTLLHVGMPWQTLPGLWVLGIILGWLYERTGNLWPSIFMHAGFNALNILMMFYITQQG